MAITPIDMTFTAAPTGTDLPTGIYDADFQDKVDNILNFYFLNTGEENTFITKLEGMITEINATTTAMNTTQTEVETTQDEVEATQVEIEATQVEVEAAALIAQGAANYQGDWLVGTTYAVGDSVSYNGVSYVSKVGSNVGNTPDVSTTEWLLVSFDVVLDTSPTLGGDLECDGYTLNGSSYVQSADASLGVGIHTFDFSAGDMQQVTATGDFSIAFANFPTGKVCTMIVDAVDWGAYSIAHPAATLFTSGIVPVYTASGTDRLVISKDKNDVYLMSVSVVNIKAV